MKLQHGEYISYGRIESVLKTSPLVENICVLADPTQDYCKAIIVPSVPELESMTNLDAKEAIKTTEVQTKVAQSLEKYGQDMGLCKVECPKKVLLTLDEWTPDSGLVTAAFKIRRRFVSQKYASELQKLQIDC